MDFSLCVDVESSRLSCIRFFFVVVFFTFLQRLKEHCVYTYNTHCIAIALTLWEHQDARWYCLIFKCVCHINVSAEWDLASKLSHWLAPNSIALHYVHVTWWAVTSQFYLLFFRSFNFIDGICRCWFFSNRFCRNLEITNRISSII